MNAEYLKDRVVIVTGGANGIGKAYCTELVRSGGRVLVADLDQEGAESLAAGLNDSGSSTRAAAVGVDVTSIHETHLMVEAALTNFGRVDVLVNNAGSYPHVRIDDIDLDAWRKVLTLNLDSVFLCTKAVLPTMTEQGGGSIINVSTNLVWSGLANMAHYIAAKSGVVGLTKALARELGPRGITVNAIAPGAVIPPARLTRAGQDAVDEIVRYQAVNRPQTPDDLVGAMRFLCSSDSEFITGQVLTVDGGLTMH